MNPWAITVSCCSESANCDKTATPSERWPSKSIGRAIGLPDRGRVTPPPAYENCCPDRERRDNRRLTIRLWKPWRGPLGTLSIVIEGVYKAGSIVSFRATIQGDGRVTMEASWRAGPDLWERQGAIPGTTGPSGPRFYGSRSFEISHNLILPSWWMLPSVFPSWLMAIP